MNSSRAVAPLATFAVGDLLLERYSQSAGFTAPPEAHAHEEVQLGLNVNSGGRYRYRGGVHLVGVAQMTLIASGERHRPGDGNAAPTGAEYRTLYIPQARWRSVRKGIENPAGGLGLKQPIVDNPALATRLLELHRMAERGERGLGLDSLVETVLLMLATMLRGCEPVQAKASRRQLHVAREYIDAHAEDRLPLSQLAAVATMSPARLCRTFSDHFGIPPHRYQQAVRISRAKKLLFEGHAVAQVAIQTGFVDQAHLTRIFKALVGITPGRFAAGASAN